MIHFVTFFNSSIVELNNTLFLYLIVVYLLLTTYYNLHHSLNFNFLLTKRNLEDDNNGTITKKPKLELDENNSYPQNTGSSPNPLEPEDFEMYGGINVSPLNLDNGIDLNSQVEVHDILNDNFFGIDYSFFSEGEKRLVANQIAVLALTYVNLGGYLSDLYLSDRIEDKFIIDLLIEILGREVISGEDSDSSSDSGSNSNPGIGSNPEIGSNSSSNVPGSTNNSNFAGSIIERIIV